MDSPSFKIFKNIQIKRIPIALTPKLFFEYESVLTRHKILKLINVDIKDIILTLDALVALAQKSETHYLWRPNLTDENDNFVLEAAVSTSAIIITKNVSDFKSGELKFPGIIVKTPQEFCDTYL